MKSSLLVESLSRLDCKTLKLQSMLKGEKIILRALVISSEAFSRVRSIGELITCVMEGEARNVSETWRLGWTQEIEPGLFCLEFIVSDWGMAPVPLSELEVI